MKERSIILAVTGETLADNPGPYIDTVIIMHQEYSYVIHAFDGGYVE